MTILCSYLANHHPVSYQSPTRFLPFFCYFPVILLPVFYQSPAILLPCSFHSTIRTPAGFLNVSRQISAIFLSFTGHLFLPYSASLLGEPVSPYELCQHTEIANLCEQTSDIKKGIDFQQETFRRRFAEFPGARNDSGFPLGLQLLRRVQCIDTFNVSNVKYSTLDLDAYSSSSYIG